MRLERVIASTKCMKTPQEPWHANINRLIKGHWYEASTQFSAEYLGEGAGRSCLVVGSPIFEAYGLIKAGWDVTYFDVRKAPVSFRFVQGDAAEMPFADGEFDAVSSACVLTHVGLGRYGDPLHENGDELALGHMARVLKPGGLAAITFGPVIDADCVHRIGTAHRIYTVAEAKRMLEAVGLKLAELAVWNTGEHRWRKNGEKLSKSTDNADYLSTFSRKPC